MRASFILFLIMTLASGACRYIDFAGEPLCQVCRRPMHQATFYSIYLEGEENRVEVCCPRCGLYFQQGRDDVLRAEVADFDTGELVTARDATFVENSSVHLCCNQEFVQKDRSGRDYVLSWDRCLPSLVAFRYRQAAARFTLTKGGVIRSYDDLLADDR